MRFHTKRRKLVATQKLRFPLVVRVYFVGFGAALAWLAAYPRDLQHFVSINWLGQPCFPIVIIPMAILMALLSLLPASWIERSIQRVFR
jgi:hypothetical protein